MPDLLTTEEAATYLRLSERKLYELVANAAVPCSKVTGRWLFPKAALDRWVAAGLLTTAPLARPAPPIVGGSHDPLLEWALRESGSGLATLPEGTCAAFEFRHGSWLNEELFARFRTRNLALCIADSETMATPIMVTADYAYFRLRDEGYSDADIADWAHRIRAATTGCKDVYVYFKHEEAGKGPQFARVFTEALTRG